MIDELKKNQNELKSLYSESNSESQSLRDKLDDIKKEQNKRAA
jgi:flagellar biosynthesis chaperone FliJ